MKDLEHYVCALSCMSLGVWYLWELGVAEAERAHDIGCVAVVISLGLAISGYWALLILDERRDR